MSEFQLPFAAVASAHEHELLAEVSVLGGNAGEIAKRILRRLPSKPGRRSYAYEGFSFHFLTEGRFIFLCMEKGCPAPKAFAFLAEMQQSWRQTFADTRVAASFKDFNLTLSEMRARTERGGIDDDLEEVNAKLSKTKEIMSDNIEKVLDRGEKIELLVDKTDNLHQQAFRFARSSTQLKRQYQWQDLRCKLIMGAAVVGVCLMIGMMLCGGPTFTSCRT